MTSQPGVDPSEAAACLEAAPDAIIAVDSEGRITMANAEAARLFGYAKSRLMTLSIDELVPDDVRRTHRALRRRYAEAPRVRSMGDPGARLLGRCSDGTLIPVEIALSPVLLSGKSIVIVAIRDVSERLVVEAQQEKRLRESEEAFRSAFERAPVPMALVDLSDPGSRLIVNANDAFADMLQYSTDDLTGRSMADVTHPDDVAADDDGARSILSGSGSYMTEKRYLRSDGVVLWGALHASLVTQPDGRQLALAHIVDVTRRHQAEAERDRREELLAVLAEIRKAALDEFPADHVLGLSVSAAADLVEADHCLIAAPGGKDLLICRSMITSIMEQRTGQMLPEGSMAEQALNSGKALISEDLALDTRSRSEPHEHVARIGPAVFMPLLASDSIEGVLIVCRPSGSKPFTEPEVSTVRALAAEAAVTLVLARVRDDKKRMLLVEDRERIARDLHDAVIQRLFASGMALQATLGTPDRLHDRAVDTISELDETIAVIRSSIFELTRPDNSITVEVERLIDRHRAVGRNHVLFDVDADLVGLGAELQDQLIPTLNELLANVERHADAETARVTITTESGLLTVRVVDDGKGIDPNGQGGFGLRNLERRATSLGGTLRYGTGPNRTGTEVVWAVPIIRG